MSHGMVLTDDEIKYDDLTKFGKVSISYETGEVEIKVEGFEFADASSCRYVATKALHWARDILTRQIEAQKLAPGGLISCSCD